MNNLRSSDRDSHPRNLRYIQIRQPGLPESFLCLFEAPPPASPKPPPLPGNSWAASCDYMLHTCPRFVYKWNQAGGARFTLAFYHSASWFWDSSNLLHLSITTFPGISPAHDGPSRLYAIGSICYCNFVWILVSTCMRKTVYPFLPSPLLGFLLFFL